MQFGNINSNKKEGAKTFLLLGILLFLCFAPFHFCKSQVIYKNTDKQVNAFLTKDGSSIDVKYIEVVLGKYYYLDKYEMWKGKIFNGCVFSFGDDTLGCFNIPDNLSIRECDDTADEAGNLTGSCYDVPKGELTIQLPYFPNGKSADIFDPSGKKVLTIDLSSKATCNENDQCDRPVEDGENCPQDCKNNEPKIDQSVVQLSANNQAATQDAEKKITLADLGWWGIAILIVLLAGGGIGYYVYRRNREFEH